MRVAVDRSSTAQRFSHHALGSCCQECSRQVHDPFLAGKAPSAGFAGRQYHDIRVKSGSPDLTGLPQTVFGLTTGGQHECSPVGFGFTAYAVSRNVNHLEIAKWLCFQGGLRCLLTEQCHASRPEHIGGLNDFLLAEFQRL